MVAGPVKECGSVQVKVRKASGITITYLSAQECGFPEYAYKTEENTFTTVSERQVEMRHHIPIVPGSEKTKCQTQTKVNPPTLKAKVSALEWTLWKNIWQRYLKVTGLEGNTAVTQLCKCLSSWSLQS